MAGGTIGAAEPEPAFAGGRPDTEDKVVRYSFKATATFSRANAVVDARLVERRKPGEPLILGGFPERSLRRLQCAYPRALKKVREVAACAGLFAELGADGIEVLSTTVYGALVSEEERQLCEDSGALVVITVGGSRTVLCEAFGWRDRGTAAVILIHEALHAAGMTEKPADPNALSSHEINRLVSTSCGL